MLSFDAAFLGEAEKSTHVALMKEMLV